MPPGGESAAGAEVEAVIEIELLGDADSFGAEWDEDFVWIVLKDGPDEIDVGVAVAAAAGFVVFAAVILADVKTGAGRWKESGSGEAGEAGE